MVLIFSVLIVREAPPDGVVFTGTSSKFVVPVARLPSSAVTGILCAASIWNGISSIDEERNILQAGIYIDVIQREDGSQHANHGAWWEWLPALATDIDSRELSVKPGDEFVITLFMVHYNCGGVILRSLSID